MIEKVPQITTEVMSVFNVTEEHKLGEELGKDALKLAGSTFEFTKKIGSTLINPKAAKDEKAKPAAKDVKSVEDKDTPEEKK